MIPIFIHHQHWLEFLLAMTEKEVKARYKHALLGFLWVILNPLLQMAVIGFIFRFFIPVKVDNYFLFLFSGLLPWNFFFLSLTKATPSIIFERALIQKAAFPREAIPLSIVLSNLFHFLISVGLLILIVVGSIVLHHQVLNIDWGRLLVKCGLLVFSIGWLTGLTSSLALILTALNVKYRDVNFMVQAVLPLWFYATPIVYGLDLLPDGLAVASYFNPLTAIIELYHYVFLGYYPLHLSSWWISLAMTILIAVGGWWFFKHESKNFDDWI